MPPKKCRYCRHFDRAERGICWHPESRTYTPIGDEHYESAEKMRTSPVCGPQARLFAPPRSIAGWLMDTLLPSEPASGSSKSK